MGRAGQGQGGVSFHTNLNGSDCPRGSASCGHASAPPWTGSARLAEELQSDRIMRLQQDAKPTSTMPVYSIREKRPFVAMVSDGGKPSRREAAWRWGGWEMGWWVRKKEREKKKIVFNKNCGQKMVITQNHVMDQTHHNQLVHQQDLLLVDCIMQTC